MIESVKIYFDAMIGLVKYIVMPAYSVVPINDGSSLRLYFVYIYYTGITR